MSITVFIKPKTWKTAQKMLVNSKDIEARLSILPEDMADIQDTWSVVISENLKSELECYGNIRPSDFIMFACNQCGDRTLREFKMIKKNALTVLRRFRITNVTVERC